ncbi:MAG TPA: TRAP transporter substrate-binding protein [Phycisphaerales bacterium]|nr:TRAP transporter substrate-binding protein [Phycisphaerales bacterium]
MKKEISFLICGVLIGALIATCGFAVFLRGSKDASGNRGRQVVLKLGHSLDPSHPVHKAMEFMNERVAELSGQTVRIDIYPSSVLGSEVQCIEQLQNGSLAMTKTSTASVENFVPEMSVFGLPYLFRNEAHYWDVLTSEVGKELLEKMEVKQLRGLCYYDSGSRNFYTKDRPIRTPDDLKGLKIRVMNSRTAMDMVSALGAAPTPIAWGELYTALAQGTVDGAENNPPSFTTNKHYEICKHFSKDAHTRVPDVLLISTEVWKGLGSQVQQWLQQAADESSVLQRKLWKEKTLESLEQAKAEGVTIYEVDQSLFAEKVKPMYEAIEDERIKVLVTRMREVKP